MKNNPKILKRGKIIYILNQEDIIAYVGFDQWLSYNKYMNWNRQGISQMRSILLKSKEDEYASPSELLSLAATCNLIGTSTRRPEGFEL